METRHRILTDGNAALSYLWNPRAQIALKSVDIHLSAAGEGTLTMSLVSKISSRHNITFLSVDMSLSTDFPITFDGDGYIIHKDDQVQITWANNSKMEFGLTNHYVPLPD